MNCCHLHVHSSYSFRDGLALPAELVQKAVDLGQPGIGLTDHGALFGAPAFFKACRDQPIKGVIGMEAYEAVPYEIDPEAELQRAEGSEYKKFQKKWERGMIRYYHLTLWVMNEQGWINLCALHSLSFGNAYKPKNQPLIDRFSLEKHSEGLICGLGCPASRVNITLRNEGYDRAYEEAEWYANVFDDRLYVEVMAALPEQVAALRDQRKLAEKLGCPTLAVNDVHYLERADGRKFGPHHVLVQARKFKSAPTTDEKSGDKSDDSYGDWYGCDDFYMKSRTEMEETALLPAEIDETTAVLESVDFDFFGATNPSKPTYRVPGDDEGFRAWEASAA